MSEEGGREEREEKEAEREEERERVKRERERVKRERLPKIIGSNVVEDRLSLDKNGVVRYFQLKIL